MGKADRIIIKGPRVSAGLFLLAMIPAEERVRAERLLPDNRLQRTVRFATRR